MMKHWIIVFFSIAVVFCSLGVTELQAQDNTQREEVQRYFGYEILPYRYLTLPFDVSVNSNETGVFVDIGCVYFIFLPLFILLYFTKRKLLLSFFSTSMMLIWIIGASNSYVSTKKIGPQKGDEQNLKVVMEKVSPEAEPMAYMTTRIYLGTHKMYKPLLAMVQPFSGDSDYVTYPLLILGFLIGTFLIHKMFNEHHPKKKSLIITYWVLLFFWFKYSAGIPWYGFLFFFLSLLMLASLIQKDFNKYTYFSKFLKVSFFAYGSIWIFYAILFRVGDVTSPVAKQSDIGTTMLSPQFFDYQIGNRTEQEVFEAFNLNLKPAIDAINRNPETNILRIGTSFSYFIANNTNRIYIDNQLGMFDQLNKNYKAQRTVIADVLRASNFKYIIIDLNTPNIDKTPEQSLKKKYNALMNFLINNPRLKLLGTDRSFVERDPSTRVQSKIFKVFPNHEIKSKVYYGGSYAIYEIL